MRIGRHFPVLAAGAIVATMLAACAATTTTPLNYSSAENTAGADSITESLAAQSPSADPLIRDAAREDDANKSHQTNLQTIVVAAAAPQADPFIVDTGPPQHVDPQGTYYVEFRSRWLHEYGPLTVIGHTYILYGRLDESGKPLDQHFVALYPHGGVLGLIGGSLPIVVPATTVPVWGDREFTTMAVYRTRINAAQYDKLAEFVYKWRSQSNWFNVYTENCNFFASQVALLIGLKTPLFTAQPTELFVAELAMLNGQR